MYIKQLQSLLGFDPEKSSKVKKSDKNDLQLQKSENDSNTESLENRDGKSNIIKDKATRHRHASVDSNKTYDLVTKIESDAEDFVKSPYTNHDYKSCNEDTAETRVSCRKTLSRFSPCNISQQDTSSRSSIESPRFCTQDYPPNETNSSPANCAIQDGGVSNTSCTIEERATCLQNDLIPISSNSASSDVTREQFDWWDRVCNKSQMSSIFDLVDDCSLNANKHVIQSHSDNIGWVNKNSRQHPYKRLELRNNAISDNWDDVFQIKVETHTPPPYDDRSEFSCQQQYSSCQRFFTSKYPSFDGTRTKRLTLWKSMKHVSSASYRL